MSMWWYLGNQSLESLLVNYKVSAKKQLKKVSLSSNNCSELLFKRAL